LSQLENQRGVSLINILVAVALAAVASGVLLYIQSSIQSNLANISNQTAYVLLDSDILRITENETLCASAFNNSTGLSKYSGATISLASVKIGNTALVSTGAIFDRGLRASSIQLVSKSPTGKSVAGGYIRWDTDLQITFTNTAVKSNPQTVKSYPLSLKTFSDGTIVACGVTAITSSNASLGYSCDFQTAVNVSAYTRTSNGKTYRVVQYANMADGAIDDGGGSANDDVAQFFCVQLVTDSGRNGFLGTCLSHEACQWR
jgi:hypothetical protein